MKHLLILFCAAFHFTYAQTNHRALSRKEAEKYAGKTWHKTLINHQETYDKKWKERVMRIGNLSMPFDVRIYGEKPSEGRSLYISMHGGGNTTKTINDQQWQNQKVLYSPKEGVYIAPRAAVDDWNMWFRPHIDTLFSQIIRCAVNKLEVNPNKVYLLGYSAGGDGVYRMAPRMADYWAAASMMAGHPGEASPVNLKNIGFMLWVGEHDNAYERNKKAIEFGLQMDSLQNEAPNMYIHHTTIVENCGHWMNRADSAAIEWMARFIRNPRPHSIVWKQEESGLRDCFYNLVVPKEEMKKGKEIRIDYNEQSIEIHKCDYNTLFIYLNDDIMDLSKTITLKNNGKVIFTGKVIRKKEHIDFSIAKRMDHEYIFSALIEYSNGKVFVR